MNKHSNVWPLQEAKARLSEVIRLAQTEGPQTVTVHGKIAVTIAAAKGGGSPRQPTVADLVNAFQSCPVPDFEIPDRPKDSRFRKIEP